MTDQSTTTHDQGPERSPDVQLAARRDLALAALRSIVPADEIGEGHRVRADGELLVCEPASVLPMAQRYFLF